MATLLPLSAVPPAMVEDLLDAAFGPERHARTAYRIRTGTEALEGLSFAALDEEGYLAGTIQAWPVALRDREGRPYPLIMIGPVAVAPGRQGEGFGKGLVTACIGALDANASPERPALPQVLIGDEAYYGAWGFSARDTGGWRCPGPFDPDRLLLRGAAGAVLPVEGMLGPWSEADAAAPRAGARPAGD